MFYIGRDARKIIVTRLNITESMLVKLASPPSQCAFSAYVEATAEIGAKESIASVRRVSASKGVQNVQKRAKTAQIT